MTTPDVQKKAPEAPTQTGKGSLMPFIAAAVFATGSTGAAAQDIILGTQNYNQGCYDTQNVLSPNSSSKMEMMINGEPMNLVVQRDTNGRVNLILAEKRDRTWFAGRCFDVWNGQVYPTYPNPDGK